MPRVPFQVKCSGLQLKVTVDICILKFLLLLLPLKLRYLWQLNDWFVGPCHRCISITFFNHQQQKGLSKQRKGLHVALYACLFFLISNIDCTRKHAQNGFGLLFPAGCWVEVAELAAPCWCLVTRSPALRHRIVGWMKAISSRVEVAWVMFEKFEFQCSRETSQVLARDQSLLCVGW